VLHSFARDYFKDLDYALKSELARRSEGPIDLFDVPLETARFASTRSEDPFLRYLRDLYGDRAPDLVIAIAGPATRFCVHHRKELFPDAPLLLAGLESRVLKGIALPARTAVVSVVIDFTAAVEHILRMRPDVSQIVVILGGSAISRLWLAETRREFAPLSDRLRFTWLQGLSLDELQERVAALPPRTAVLFGEYGDAAGIREEQDRALASLRRVSSVPIFGLFETQLGEGIVGGPLLSESEAGRKAGEAAHRILSGERPEKVEIIPVTAGAALYDFRELERWGIRESTLPAGSRVLYRPVQAWKAYPGPVAAGVSLVALQAAIILGLLLQRSRRRLAQEEARMLARRLLTAREDERRKLARELHEDLSQRLARLSIDAARVERQVPDSAGKEPARAMRADLSRLSEDVDALAYQLHPSVLDDLGLNEALKVECEQFSRRESMAARLVSFQAPSALPPEVAVSLLRIAQEALRNVARHSRARRVTIEVTSANGTLHMNVRDDGVGFLPGGRRVRSLGLASMRERAGLVGGRLEIESAPGRGTTVTVTVPV
jgi:signal transduction histidine kinase